MYLMMEMMMMMMMMKAIQTELLICYLSMRIQQLNGRKHNNSTHCCTAIVWLGCVLSCWTIRVGSTCYICADEWKIAWWCDNFSDTNAVVHTDIISSITVDTIGVDEWESELRGDSRCDTRTFDPFVTSLATGESRSENTCSEEGDDEDGDEDDGIKMVVMAIVRSQ